jgi:hypothetical protein
MTNHHHFSNLNLFLSLSLSSILTIRPTFTTSYIVKHQNNEGKKNVRERNKILLKFPGAKSLSPIGDD